MIFVFFIATIVSNTSLIPNQALCELGLIFLGLFMWLYGSLGQPLRSYYWLILPYTAYAIIMSLDSPDDVFVIYLAQPVILSFVLSYKFPIASAESSSWTAICMPILCVIMVFTSIDGFLGNNVFINTNMAGGIAGLLIIAVSSAFVGNKAIFVQCSTIIASCIVLVNSDSRGALLMLVTYMAITYVAFSRYFVAHIGGFAAFVAVTMASPFLYNIYNAYFDTTASLVVLGKPLETGRQIIWQLMIDQVWQFPIFGRGRTDPGYFLDSHYAGASAHNLYLQTAFEFGAIGVSLLLLIFFVQYLRLRGSSPGAVRGRALLCAVMVHEMFEVSLTQNSFSFGILVWAMLARFEALKEHDEAERVGSVSTG